MSDDGSEILFEEACGDWVCLFNPFAVGTLIIWLRNVARFAGAEYEFIGGRKTLFHPSV